MAFRILDATSFYAGIPFASQDEYHTTPQVFDEIKHIKKRHGALEVLIESGRLRIVEPEKQFVDQAVKKSMDSGDYQQLSRGDISVIALCLQLGGEIVTDDFAVSNVAKHLGLAVLPVMTGGAEKLDWTYFCPGCETVSPRAKVCQVCGTPLVRKRVKN